MLYCRHKLYPLGLPNWLAHGMALVLGLLSVLLGRWGRFLPLPPRPITVSVTKSGVLKGSFAFLMVTTLQRLLFTGSMTGASPSTGSMQLLVIERSFPALVSAFIAAVRGRLGRHRLHGVHLERGDEIRIQGSRSSVILDGELFEANDDRPIILKPTPPVPFLRLAV
jgi:hypothetical protein